MTPTWIDMIPVYGSIVTVASIGIKIGQLLQKLDSNTKAVEKLENRMSSIENRVTILESTTVRITKA